MTTTPDNGPDGTSGSEPAATAGSAPTEALVLPDTLVADESARPVPPAPAAKSGSQTRTVLEIVGGVVALGAVAVAAVAGFAFGYLVRGHDSDRPEFAMSRMWSQQDDGQDQQGQGAQPFGQGQQGPGAQPFGGGQNPFGQDQQGQQGPGAQPFGGGQNPFGRDQQGPGAQPFGGQDDSSTRSRPALPSSPDQPGTTGGSTDSANPTS